MAVGDQWIMFGDGNTTIRPSSGVEVIIKTAMSYAYNSSNYSYLVHRSSSSSGSYYAIVSGSYIGYGGAYNFKPSAQRAYNVYSAAVLAENVAIPINNTHYMDHTYAGSPSMYFYVGGYITKD